MKQASEMRSDPANPVDGRAYTAGRKAGSDQGDAEFLRGFSPVIRMYKPIGIRPTDQTSIGRRFWSNRPSCRSIAVKSKVRIVSRKGRATRSHPRAKRPGLALNRSTKCHPPGRGCGAGEPYVSLRYDYHAGGPLATMQIEDPDHRILSSGSVLDVLRTSIPDALGNIGTITYGNGVVIQSRYSTTGVLQQVTTQGNGPLSDYLYRWNDEGMLIEKQDLLMADGINRSEQFSYDRSRRLVEATGPYGDRNTPHRTLQYAYGMDGQPIVADEKAYHYDVSSQHRLSSYNQRVYTYDNVLSPDKHKGLVMERKAPGNEVTRFLYHWTGRIKQSQSIRANTITTVDYEYDTEGNRFIKRTDVSGIVSEIHDLSSDYRIHADGSSEVHTIEIRNGNDPVARFRFQDNHHNSGVWAPSSLFSHRLGADLLRIAAFEGGIAKLPSLLGLAFSDAYYAVKLLPQIQNKAKLFVLLYWTLASFVALAALVLLVRAWHRSPDESPGLLPVAVYRFGSVLALLSFSAVCVKTPATADDSTYLLLANGVLGAGSEGNSNSNSNILSVLGAFYYISTHNGSTDIVTNADGMAIARFAYEPFGKVNTELTDLDPDRNGVHYGESFMFTGQEFEPEIGLYNYKARIYDQETGRFLQPDPVHTENVGFDNWDRYQYANNNPVNFTDPTGESTNFVHMFNKILKNTFHGFNHAIKSGIHGNNRIMSEIAHNFNGLFPGHQGNGRFSISDARMKAAANLWDSVVGKKGFWGFAARIYREYLSGILENPVALMAIGTIVACVFACAPFFAYAAGVAGLGTAVTFSETVFIGGLQFIWAGWGAGYLLSGMSRTTLANLNFDKHRANAGGYLGASVAAVTVAGVFGYAGWKDVISPFLEKSFIGQMPVEGHHGLTMFDATRLSLSWGLPIIDLFTGDYQSTAYGFTTAYYGIPIPYDGLKRLYESISGDYNARL